MSRITGTDAANLIEAYNSLYAPQEEVELTEEQVQEDFENWVNSLVEEGHDLSEYTWEDMYEEYLNEMGRTMTTGQATAPRPVTSPRPTPAATGYNPAGGGMGGMRGSGRDRNATQTSSSPGALRVKPTFQNTGGYGRYAPPSMQQRTPAPTRPSATPAAPTARPAAQPVGSGRPTPAPQKPTATATPPGPPSRYNPLMQKTFGYQTGNAPDQIAKASAGAPPAPAGGALGAAARPEVRTALNLPARPAAATPAPAPATTPAAPKPQLSARAQALKAGGPQGGARARVLNQDLDLFDIVKGYLIDEGYAETEEAAAVIMANMSDEWRQSIMEGPGGMMMSLASKGQGQLVKTQPNKPTQSTVSGGLNPIKFRSGMK